MVRCSVLVQHKNIREFGKKTPTDISHNLEQPKRLLNLIIKCTTFAADKK